MELRELRGLTDQWFFQISSLRYQWSRRAFSEIIRYFQHWALQSLKGLWCERENSTPTFHSLDSALAWVCVLLSLFKAWYPGLSGSPEVAWDDGCVQGKIKGTPGWAQAACLRHRETTAVEKRCVRVGMRSSKPQWGKLAWATSAHRVPNVSITFFSCAPSLWHLGGTKEWTQVTMGTVEMM